LNIITRIMIIKILLIWLIIAFAETIQGILRIKYVSRKIGEPLARKLGVVTGSIIILLIGWFAIPWIEPSTVLDCLIIGIIWLFLMVSFDVILGRYIFHFSWKRIVSDFNIFRGNFLVIGMAVLFFTPIIIALVRNLI